MQFQSIRDQAPDGTTYEDSYVWNSESREATGATPTLGPSYDMNVTFTLADGASFGSLAAVPLAAFSDAWSQPLACVDDPYSFEFDAYWYQQNGQSCFGSDYSLSGVAGDVVGEPAALP
jgi:hypothetical protein